MKIYADTALLKLQLLMLAGIVVATVLGAGSLSSMLFTMTFFLTVGFWAAVAEQRIAGLSWLAILIMFVSCVSVLINAMITNTVPSFSYLKKMIMFWSTLLFLATMREYSPETSVVTFLFRVNTWITLVLIGSFLLQRGNLYLIHGRIGNYLTFGFTNPNLTAAFLAAACIVDLLCAYAANKWWKRCFYLMLAGFLVYFVVLTQSRTALLLLVAFLVVFAVTVFFPRLKLKMTGWMAAVIAVFPALFASVYMFVVYSSWFQKLFSFLVDEGKELDSRVVIWTNAFNAIGASPIIGAYSQISGGDGSSQMHNSHLDVAASYGVPVLILVCVFLYRVLYPKGREAKSGMSFVATMGFSLLLMSGVGEAMMFSGGLGIYIYLGAILLLANYDWNTERETI